MIYFLTLNGSAQKNEVKTMDQSLVKTITRIETNIDNLFLDPNNPRFVSPEWEYILEDNIIKPAIQDNITGKLINGLGVEKLASNIKINGFLKIDRVVVKSTEALGTPFTFTDLKL